MYKYTVSRDGHSGRNYAFYSRKLSSQERMALLLEGAFAILKQNKMEDENTKIKIKFLSFSNPQREILLVHHVVPAGWYTESKYYLHEEEIKIEDSYPRLERFLTSRHKDVRERVKGILEGE